ncbi:induced myeloid leukemia cell differentiation protein Mcl-1 [Pseudonaja textilis]|uniref:induced myeloid leukemia cell differentiation protein Mcl-1 n=1 Tax=Pseudonaja textilis TaxID=8673 RepID=UPI000EA9E44C|nr:induced myeloid leukemia cell differentiation protein Mcl-1 [Pseudonaja textilis]
MILRSPSPHLQEMTRQNQDTFVPSLTFCGALPKVLPSLLNSGMLRKVQIDKADDLKLMSEVATQVFNDGITNWGRIVTLISFGAFVAKHLKSINQESGISTLAEIITEVLVTEKREWLLHHNAWEGFVKFFHVEDLEGSIRNILVAFAGVAGLGASLAYLIR